MAPAATPTCLSTSGNPTVWLGLAGPICRRADAVGAERAARARVAHFRRQQDDALSLLAGMQAEREEAAALSPVPLASGDALLADIARQIVVA